MSSYRTAKIWIMYVDLVSILRSLIESARSGNLKLYLQSLHQMLPYLAATGHNNYCGRNLFHCVFIFAIFTEMKEQRIYNTANTVL